MPSKIQIHIRAELRDQSGKIIKRYPWKKANSLLRQFILMLTAQMSNTATAIFDTGNISRSISGYATNLNVNAGAGTTTMGSLIGTGTTPVAMTDIKLETPLITNVAHAAVSFASENPDASTWRLAIARVFTNNTGATIGIREVALYCFAASGNFIICIDHTLYSVDVPAGVAVTLTYRITISL